jgi:predicted aspartyl protease
MIWRILALIVLWPCLVHAACVVRQSAAVTLEIAGTVVLAPVTVNGTPGWFILDTGSSQTIVTPASVDRFHLTLDEWTATTMRGVGGVERHRNADPRSIEMGGVALHRRSLAQDTTLRVASLPRGEVGGKTVDGLLGRDFLSVFDLDLDFPRRLLTLYAVSGCGGRFLYWARDYAVVTIENPTESAIVVPLTLDGIALRALLDTGASQTLVAAPGMARLGLGLERLRDDPSQIVGGMGPHTVTMWHHRFDSMRIGGETLTSPSFLVAPIQLSPISDMLLGADWLMGRRVWISYATNQLFVMAKER